MPTLNINIPYENLPQGVTNQEETLNLIIYAVTKKTGNNISFDERKLYQGIYLKIREAISNNNDVVDLSDYEMNFLKNAFIETYTTISESTNIYKLESTLMN